MSVTGKLVWGVACMGQGKGWGWGLVSAREQSVYIGFSGQYYEEGEFQVSDSGFELRVRC